MDELSKERLVKLLGEEPTSSRRIERGYTPAERWQVTLAGGSTAFVKVGCTPATAAWLRAEHAVYERVSRPCMPALLGFDDHPQRPLLALEDLSAASWPPPWRAGDVERLLEALRGLSATPLPPGVLPELEGERARFAGWLHVERDPGPFLSLGLCSEAWLSNALPSLLLAQDLAWLGGSDLVHGDLRSDNLCFLPDRVVLVDWNAARRGNGALDLAMLALSLRLEGGPAPDELVADGPLAALVCGYFAAQAGLRPIPDAPRVRWIQLRRLRIALPWVARTLGLPAPDGTWVRRSTMRLDAALEEGAIDEARWLEELEELLGDAWLAEADEAPEAGSPGALGFDAELTLEALPQSSGRPCRVLDVGPGDGRWLQQAQRAGEARSRPVEATGLVPSWRFLALAERRAPAQRPQLQVGAALYHTPERRHELVRVRLEALPRGRQGEAIRRLRRELLAPGGRLLIGPEPGARGASLPERVEALGLPVGGVLERPHPSTGEPWFGVWLEAEPA